MLTFALLSFRGFNLFFVVLCDLWVFVLLICVIAGFSLFALILIACVGCGSGCCLCVCVVAFGCLLLCLLVYLTIT